MPYSVEIPGRLAFVVAVVLVKLLLFVCFEFLLFLGLCFVLCGFGRKTEGIGSLDLGEREGRSGGEGTGRSGG